MPHRRRLCMVKGASLVTEGSRGRIVGIKNTLRRFPRAESDVYDYRHASETAPSFKTPGQPFRWHRLRPPPVIDIRLHFGENVEPRGLPDLR